MTYADATPRESALPLDYDRLYAHRHRGVEQATRTEVWELIAEFLYKRMGCPTRVLDPVAGGGEFINAVRAPERWASDAQSSLATFVDKDVHCVIGDVFELDLPADAFGGIFVSNFLEHLHSPEAVQAFLARMRTALALGGRLVILGPNIRCLPRHYFDFADHRLPLSHVTVVEHLAMAGMEATTVVPRFLPYSFTGRLPSATPLVRAYLKFPLAWRLLGKQFLVIAEK